MPCAIPQGSAAGTVHTAGRCRRGGGAVALLLGLAGCTTTGTGGGQLSSPGWPDEQVAFTWSSTDGAISGVMRASSAGAQFQGRFFQITQQTRTELLHPLWTHWGWPDRPYWGRRHPAPAPATQFVTHYSGKVVASLQAAGELRMRCRFDLVDPARGMSGGGEGECQRSDGRLVHAVFAGD